MRSRIKGRYPIWLRLASGVTLVVSLGSLVWFGLGGSGDRLLMIPLAGLGVSALIPLTYQVRLEDDRIIQETCFAVIARPYAAIHTVEMSHRSIGVCFAPVRADRRSGFVRLRNKLLAAWCLSSERFEIFALTVDLRVAYGIIAEKCGLPELPQS